MNQYKIVLVVPELKLGGTENHTISLAVGLQKRGYQVTLLTLHHKGVLAEKAKALGVSIDCLNLKGNWDIMGFLKLYHWFRTHPADIVQTYLFGYHLFAGIPARLCGVPLVISTRRGRAVDHWQKKRDRLIGNLGNLFVDEVVCVSEDERQWTLKHEQVNPNKVMTIRNGVDMERFSESHFSPSSLREGLKISHTSKLIGTVANFSREKGYGILIDALEEVLEKDSGAHAMLVGDGPLRGEMEAKVQKGNYRDRIHFLGFQSHAVDYIRAMDVFVLASVVEGCPNALLEAMSLQKPIVSTRGGGIPELINSDEEGLLVPPHDAAAIANAVKILLADSSLAEKYAENAYRRIQNEFSQDKMIDRYEKLYFKYLEKDSVETVEAPSLSEDRSPKVSV